jgi:tyrosine-protein phosphatase YwqE
VTKVREQKEEIKELKGKVDSLQKTHAESIPIYPGAPIKMDPANLSYIQSETREGSIVRNLMRYFFTERELAEHSRTGKQCAANLRKDDVLPALDPTKMDAIMGKHLF